MKKKLKLTKEEISWSLYDVANSAFILMLTAMIPPYVASIGQAAGLSGADTSSDWAFTQSGATLAVALLAPVLGVLADRKGRKKLFFLCFFALAIVMFFAMAFIDDYKLLLAVNILTGIGYAGANIFYDAFLIDITTDERMDFISSLGFAVGYIGSCVPFIVSILLYMTTPFGLNAMSAVKVGMLINAVWWLVFTVPMLKNVHQKYHVSENGEKRGFAYAFREIGNTIKLIVKDRHIGLFLLAYFFYIDGVDTIIKLSTSYGQALGLDTTAMIVALLVTQIVAFPAVLVFSRISKLFSTKKVLLFSVLVYMGICIFGYFMDYEWQFWVLAIAVGLVQGTIQALSRSYFGKLIPKERNNEYFGFYNIFGKYATIIGPVLMGIFTKLTGNSRYGVLSIILLFAAGFVALLFVPDVGKADAEEA